MSSSAIKIAPPANPVTVTGVASLASNSALACNVGLGGKRAVEGKKFRVRAEGSAIVAVGTTTVKPQLLAVAGANPPASPLVIGSWTALAGGTAQACPTTGCPWWVECELIIDSNSGLMHGTVAQLVNNTFVAPAAITGVVTGLNGTNSPIGGVAPADPVVTFALGLTLSAAGTVTVANFEISF